MTITLDLPEALARQLLALPDSDRVTLLTEFVSDAFADTPTDGDLAPLTEADKAALKQSRADLDAGRVFPFATVLADVRREHNLPLKPQTGTAS